MSISQRAEQIGGIIFAQATGHEILEYDNHGRQRAVDYVYFTGPDENDVGALEVTLIHTSGEVIGLLERENHTWPVAGKWNFRLPTVDIHYRELRNDVVAAAKWCEPRGITDLREYLREYLWSPELPDEVRRLIEHGACDLQQRSYGDSGISVLPPVIVGFPDNDPPLETIIDDWIDLEHIPAHIEKLRQHRGSGPTNLFLVVVEENLPMRYFTNDFDVPRSPLQRYGGIDYVWIWSRFWHATLRFANADGSWEWKAWDLQD